MVAPSGRRAGRAFRADAHHDPAPGPVTMLERGTLQGSAGKRERVDEPARAAYMPVPARCREDGTVMNGHIRPQACVKCAWRRRRQHRGGNGAAAHHAGGASTIGYFPERWARACST